VKNTILQTNHWKEHQHILHNINIWLIHKNYFPLSLINSWMKLWTFLIWSIRLLLLVYRAGQYIQWNWGIWPHSNVTWRVQFLLYLYTFPHLWHEKFLPGITCSRLFTSVVCSTALPQSRISRNMGLRSWQESVLSKGPEITQRTNVYVLYKLI
jgi:hypothetical protein